MIKVMNGIKSNPNLMTLDELSDGDTFIRGNDLCIMIEGDPEIMIPGGDAHGYKEEFGGSEAEDITVEVVDVEITVVRRPIP